MNSVLAIGLMSGTSMDGVDAALVETDGDMLVRPHGFITIPYGEGDRQTIRAAMDRALALVQPVADPVIAAASALIDRRHIEAVAALLDNYHVSAADVHVIGYHGQTVAHRPDRGWTWQIGDGAALANVFGVPVVDDFRSADVAAGGQGAPLVPAYHRAMAGAAAPAVMLNIGGIANITHIAADGALLAFDTGPGNALIDDWMRETAGLSHDDGGMTAATGQVDEKVLAALLDNRWFDQPPPKSLDRADFSIAPVRCLSLADGAATLCAFTAAAVARAIGHCPSTPTAVHVAGGGRYNQSLMQALRQRLGVPVEGIDRLGWNGDATEAEAFAYLAVRFLCGLPASYPGTTGVAAPLSGGRLSMPDSEKRRKAAR